MVDNPLLIFNRKFSIPSKHPKSVAQGSVITPVKAANYVAAAMTAACGAFASVQAVTAAEAEAETHPAVSLQAILDRPDRAAQNLQWRNPQELIGEFTQEGTDEPSIVLLPLDGSPTMTLAKGRLVSVAPDGNLLVARSEGAWLVLDINDSTIVRLESAGDDRPFTALTPPVWSRDGSLFAFAESFQPRRNAEDSQSVTVNGVRIVDMGQQVPPTDRWTSRITIVRRSDMTVTQRLLIEDSVYRIGWGPDKSLYLTQVNMFGGDPRTNVLRVTPATEKPETLYSSAGRYQNMTPAVSPDGTEIALVLDVDNRVWSDFESLLLIEAKSGRELKRLTYELPMRETDYTWSKTGDEIYGRIRNGGLDQIYAIPRDGPPRQLTNGQRLHFNMTLSPDGRRLSYQTWDGYDRKDIRVLDLETGKEKVILVVDEPAKEFQLGRWEHIRFESADRVRPFAYMITPPDFDTCRKYPVIVDVHGGGPGSSLYPYGPFLMGTAPTPLEWHAWAALDYVVLVPDYRSTGDYGPDVIAARYEAGEIPAVGDVHDIVAGTRYVIGQGYADASRIAILGHSAGAGRVYLLLTRYELYAAAILNEAIPPDPVSRFIGSSTGAFAGSYSAGIMHQDYGGSLEEFPERYKTNYMFDSYRIKTPTLIMVGNERLGGMDHLANEVLYSILKGHGTPVRMLKFVEEGHTYSRPASARLAFEETRRWLEKHMPRVHDQDSMPSC